jgi:mannose-6-phosphate isomerase-like protein (cupin superfamily)
MSTPAPALSTGMTLMAHVDSTFVVPQGSTPDYDRGNSLVKLLGVMEHAELAAERQTYIAHSLEYLFPINKLEFYGPAGADFLNLNPAAQDNKNDFQKQNVRDFTLADTHLIRGWTTVGDAVLPFLRVSYRGGPDTTLSQMTGHNLGQRIKVWLRVGDTAIGPPIPVPYNPVSDRYELEIWTSPVQDLRSQLDDKARGSMDRGELIVRNDLIKGAQTDFDRGKLEDAYMLEVATNSTMHPLIPLRVELAWCDESEQFWDSQGGANYVYEFSMIIRGWDHFLSVGTSPNPHGGVGFLEFRNLMSNYFRYAERNELGRTPQPWNFDAFGRKDHNGRRENFMAVDYMDLHILKANCGIGLHRHRDNQEVFFMMQGRGYMVIGDWCKMPNRERCFEIRSLRAGHMAMLKGGNLHGLMNPSDENISLFMFGGYD